MRQSARLRASGASSKLLDENFLLSVTEEDSADEQSNGTSELNEGTSLGKNMKSKRGRPKKSARKNSDEVEVFTEEIEKLSDSDSGSIDSPDFNDSFIVEKPSSFRKKLKRNSNYKPPLESSLGINDNLLSSCDEWSNYISEENSSIKRKNRKLKTVILPGKATKDVFSQPSFSKYASGLSNVEPSGPSLKLKIGNSDYNLSAHEGFNVSDGKIGLFNVGRDVKSVQFCGCPNCLESSTIFGFAVSSENVFIISADVSSKNGIKKMEISGKIRSPKSEEFKTISLFQSILSVSTNRSVYFLNLDDLHKNTKANMKLNSSACLLEGAEEISCHSWNGEKILIGTNFGRILILNNKLEEIFQCTPKLGQSIFSVDWMDSSSFIIGGNFSKIFSIDLKDPHLIKTEVSVLASIPKVKWSSSLNSILFADVENHARKLEMSYEESGAKLHQAAGTFDSMVQDLSTSTNHNFMAAACSSGAIHLAWMSSEPNYAIEYEKKIFALEKLDDGEFWIDFSPSYVQFQISDAIKLYSNDQACTSVAWCQNRKFPGLLIGGYRNGLVAFITTDRFFI